MRSNSLSFFSFAVALGFAFLTLSSTARAQSVTVGDDVSTPNEGVGHDYIHLLSETVNPANGNVNLKLQQPVPPSRGITLPFSFQYNSDGVNHFYQSSPSVTYWTYNLDSIGGWSNGLPLLSAAAGSFVDNTTTGSTCYYVQSFIYRDPSGVQIPFGAYAGSYYSNTNQICGLGDNLTSSVDGYTIELLPGCTPTPNCDQYELYGGAKITDPHGTVYSFGPITFLGSGPLYPSLLSVEDRNGNFYTINSKGVITDTDGRTVPSCSLVTGSGECYTSTTTKSAPNYSVPYVQVSAPPAGTACAFPSKNTNSQNVTHAITLPNGRQYQFYYGTDNPNGVSNPYGLLSEIDYPSGAWVRYTWKLADQMSDYILFDGYSTSNGSDEPGVCSYQYKVPVVATREVGLAGSSQPVLSQTFSYTTTWSSTQWTQKTTTVVTTDLVRNQTFQTVYTYQPFLVQPGGVHAWPQAYQIPLESSIQYYNPGGASPVRTVTKTWTDQYEMGSQTTTLEDTSSSPISSMTTYTYQAMGLPSSITEYDFGQSSPTRTTVINYQTFGDTPIFPYVPSILDKPCQKLVYSGSRTGGSLVGETDYFYDGGTTLCGSAGTSSVSTADSPVQHDSQYAYGVSPQPPRGNLTKMTRKCIQTSCSGNPTTTWSYDETGLIVSMTDPCGNGSCSNDMTGSNHTTTYYHTDNYTVLSGGSNVGYTPNGNTNSYLTKVVDPMEHTQQFTYDYNWGQMTTAKDQNDINANRSGTTYIYNDPFARPTQVNYPDGGQTELIYNDAPPSPSVTMCELISGAAGATCSATSPPSGWKTSMSTTDGMEHVVQTELVSDPDGPTYTATSYDGLGQKYQSWNATRCSPPTTNCGSETTWGYTSYFYDALGRSTQVTDPDGSITTTTYATAEEGTTGSFALVTDEAGNQRLSRTDALGRVTNVWEAPNNSGLNWVTIYQYDALNDLTGVTENGSNSSNARVRTFVYDSLARLTSATNPESGTISYQYDLNSNPGTKLAPQAGQTGSAQTTTNYTYDVLNRVLQEAHQNPNTGLEMYAYDGTTLSGCPGPAPPSISGAANLVGRTSAMCAGVSASSWSFDQMGRTAVDSRTNAGASNTNHNYSVNYVYYKDGSLSQLTYPSGDVLTYTVLGAGRATQLSDSSNNFVGYSGNRAVYTPNGFLASMTNGNTSAFAGIVTSNIYNDRLQPVLLSASVSSTPIFSLCYDFHLGVAVNSAPCNFNSYSTGDNGDVFQVLNNVDSTRSAAYVYDPLNRVAQAYTVNTSSANCWGETYSATPTAPGVVPAPSNLGIDAWGNVTNRSGVSGMAGSCMTEGLSAYSNTQNQLNIQAYDAAGNVISDGGANQPTYDADNRISTDAGVTYSYDADGARIEKSSGTMYWTGPGGEILAETDLNGNINEEYIFFDGERIARVDRPSGAVHYYFSDKLDSASVITDASGNAQVQYFYFPYGGIVASVGSDSNHYKFTGKERDSESGLDDFGARYYASSVGRFMTPDWAARPTTVPYAAFGDPQSLNLYTYVRNDPVSRADADGHCSSTLYPLCGGGGNPTGMVVYLNGGPTLNWNPAAFLDDANFAVNDALAHQLTLSDVIKIIQQAQQSGVDPASMAMQIFNNLGDKVSVTGAVLREALAKTGVTLGGAAADLISHADSISKSGSTVTVSNKSDYTTTQNDNTLHIDKKVSFNVGTENGLPALTSINGLHVDTAEHANVTINKIAVMMHAFDKNSPPVKVLAITGSKGYIFRRTTYFPIN